MKFLALFIMSTLFTQCEIFKDDDFRLLPLTPYIGNQLRIDGYYYRVADGSNFKEGSIYSTFLFYENGITLNSGGVENNLEAMDEYIKRCTDYHFQKSKIGWGVFVIEDNTIKIEYWYPGPPHHFYMREGVILNDTTFHITKSYRSNGKEQKIKDEIYHFRQFSPKPDSTNVFIK